MMLLLIILSAAVLAGYLLLAIEAIAMRKSIADLDDSPALEEWPAVSLIVAARNEERNIEPAVRSLLAVDYPSLELVVIDDRSDDATSAILDRVTRTEPRLQVRRVDTLPEGWLGKNHALDAGARAAKGEWLLFTDADVHFEPQVVKKAVAAAVRHRADLLALGPRITGGTIPLRIFVAGFTFLFAMYARPWRAAHPKRREAIGIGAFNLVRKSALAGVGYFEKIRMRPDDDVMLARLLKWSGHRNVLGRSSGLISVEWYPTLHEGVAGLMKNAFAAVDYSIAHLAAASVALVAGTLWPLVALFTTEGPLFWINAGTVAMILIASAPGLRDTRLPWIYLVVVPFTSVLFLYVMWRAAILTLWNGGISWRGTHYDLAELRSGPVRATSNAPTRDGHPWI